MFHFGPLCSPMVAYGLLWSNMMPHGPYDMHSPLWSRRIPYGPVRSGMVLYGSVWSPIALLSPVRYQIFANIESFAFLFLFAQPFNVKSLWWWLECGKPWRQKKSMKFEFRILIYVIQEYFEDKKEKSWESVFPIFICQSSFLWLPEI